MILTNGKSKIIKNWLTRSDMDMIAGVTGYSYIYVWSILNGKRTYTNKAGDEILRVTLRRAKQNKKIYSKNVA